MATVDDNYYDIPYLTGNDTFLDWVNHYNNYTIEKLNNIRIFNGVSGDGIGFTLGTSADGATWAGILQCDLNDVITKGITFSNDVTISGSLTYDWDSALQGGLKARVNHSYGFTGISGGYTVGQPVRIELTGGTAGYEYVLAQGRGKTGAEVYGVVSKVTLPSAGPYTDSNTYMEVTTHGIITGDFSSANVSGGGLSAGSIYFLSPGVSGGITTVEPSIAGDVNKPVLLGITSDKGLVLSYRGQYLQGAGTGGTGGIDNNRFIVQIDNSITFDVGHVVGYDPNANTVDSNGWFIANSDNQTSIDKAIGLCTKTNFQLDSLWYIEITTTGWLDNFPSNSKTGLLWVDGNGKLTSDQSGSLNKTFAVAWDAGSETYRGVILNRLQDLSGAQARSTAPPGGAVGNWAIRSTTAGGTTFGSAINNNMMINGGFDVWQRDMGSDSSWGATGSTYFADRWVRLDGVTVGTPGTYAIQRNTFDTNQTEVYGIPKYYASFRNDITSGTTLDYIHVENRIEDVRTARNENVTLSFWSKCGTTGATMDIAVTQWDGATASTAYPATVSLGTLWSKYEVAFLIPDITTTPTGKHYLGVGFRTDKLTGATYDIAKVKLERGLVATNNAKINESDELDNCKRYYQRSYTVDERTHSATMSDLDTPSISIVDFTITPDKDYFYKFPIPMRDTPAITFYSPKTGYTGDAYNRTASKDLRLTSGTFGYNNCARIAGAGSTTISADYIDKNGMYISVPAGACLFDNVSLQYLADSDLTENMTWNRPS